MPKINNIFSKINLQKSVICQLAIFVICVKNRQKNNITKFVNITNLVRYVFMRTGLSQNFLQGKDPKP